MRKGLVEPALHEAPWQTQGNLWIPAELRVDQGLLRCLSPEAFLTLGERVTSDVNFRVTAISVMIRVRIDMICVRIGMRNCCARSVTDDFLLASTIPHDAIHKQMPEPVGGP